MLCFDHIRYRWFCGSKKLAKMRSSGTIMSFLPYGLARTPPAIATPRSDTQLDRRGYTISTLACPFHDHFKVSAKPCTECVGETCLIRYPWSKRIRDTDLSSLCCHPNAIPKVSANEYDVPGRCKLHDGFNTVAILFAEHLTQLLPVDTRSCLPR